MNKRKKYWKEYLLFGLISLISCAGYLIFSVKSSGIGFPLDDAWIHQTFARNFAEDLVWSFQLGQASGGSTGPIWGVILSLLHLGGIPPLWGTYFLGFLLLWGAAIAGFHIIKKIIPERKYTPLAAGVLITLEWHLVWSALSGMETLLFILVSLVLFNWLLDIRDDWWLAGLLIGMTIWIRPDGLTLIGPALFSMVMRGYSNKDFLQKLTIFLGNVLLVTAPYFLFNWLVIGDMWPNTFYAKQAEYASLRNSSIFNRYLEMSLQVVTGVGALLLPGIIIELIETVKTKKWTWAGSFIWAAGYIGIYAWRLPVTYQHGRYIMPALPILFLIGIAGMLRKANFQSQTSWKRVVSGAWGGAALLVTIAFWISGARAYALDVGVIQTEMVRTALWIVENTEKDAIIGAHDIGALGYFSKRKILDLAGLISPDVIPFIRDEDKLSIYLSEEDANYLVTFPSWYPNLTRNLSPLYNSGGLFSPLFGMDNMTVYLWK